MAITVIEVKKTGVIYKPEFDIEEVVKIPAIESMGRVNRIVIGRGGCMYDVSYWINGKREDVVLPAAELKAV